MPAPPACPGPVPDPQPPANPAPAGACDSHAHVFGPLDRFPFAAERSYTPPEAPLAAYRAMLATLGVGRAVLVQPSVHGTDNRAMLAAMAEMGDAARGVAVVGPEVPDAELAALHAAGVRGIRFNLLFKGGAALSSLRGLAARIAPLGWHVQLLVEVSAFPGLYETLAALPVPSVLDHMGHMPAAKGPEDPGFAALLALLRDGVSWVKLSAPYRLSARAAPPYDDVDPLARALVAAAPDRAVWATDWPHPAIPAAMPDDGALLDELDRWVPDPETRRRILVDNPARLYGFAAGDVVSRTG